MKLIKLRTQHKPTKEIRPKKGIYTRVRVNKNEIVPDDDSFGVCAECNRSVTEGEFKYGKSDCCDAPTVDDAEQADAYKRRLFGGDTGIDADFYENTGLHPEMED